MKLYKAISTSTYVGCNTYDYNNDFKKRHFAEFMLVSVGLMKWIQDHCGLEEPTFGMASLCSGT